MSEIKLLTASITKFRDERDWKQFHNPKDLADSFQKKMLKNAQKYPLDKAKGSHAKYTELRA